MRESHWFLISYDIRHPRRLQRTHRLLRRQATALLESLFVFYGSPQAMAQLRLQIAQETRDGIDDVLIYSLRSDRPLHRWGRACLPAGLYDFSLPPLIEYRQQRIIALHG